ncbi:bifunctional 3,4-dihydroxy-2-butanone-4-phosphate synthase/GTP cyclohydrolase II [Nitrogeniibacter aestuarii]|uniref:bifunctional 3,4-dihydroxy-2-butanone-4-phosphate synthase/GTP cyclohydrolase II n=1 Tax=Nitrogeniibacter aestuarii TaxID=2815343 RepID=UPI001D12EC7E|nr:bifunctional 3,4-dihydroxy-2-butanone-4-phosphate synthase/GTP cyclohydrolase II [Nitrogeniibacter aestuarii]
MPYPIASTEEIIAEFKAGRMVVLVDEEDRENEGDLVLAADFVSPEAINFMARHARGLICLTLTEAHCRKLGLTQMAQANGSPYSTAFTVSIEAAKGVTTGISAADRAHTIRTAVAANATQNDIVQPGHVFPIMARPGGVLVRAGHTEAGCDLATLAGLQPASVICEIMNDDGTMARLPQLVEFARHHGLKIGTITDLIHYRAASEKLVERVASKPIDTAHGPFTLHAYSDRSSGTTHLAMVKGTIPAGEDTVARVHDALSVLDFIDPASREQAFSIDQAQAALAHHGHGVILLMRSPEDEATLLARLAGQRARGRPRWDTRTYGIGAQILRDLGVRRVRLLSSPHNLPSMAGFDLEVTGFVTSPEEPCHASR